MTIWATNFSYIFLYVLKMLITHRHPFYNGENTVSNIRRSFAPMSTLTGYKHSQLRRNAMSPNPSHPNPLTSARKQPLQLVYPAWCTRAAHGPRTGRTWATHGLHTGRTQAAHGPHNDSAEAKPKHLEVRLCSGLVHAAQESSGVFARLRRYCCHSKGWAS